MESPASSRVPGMDRVATLYQQHSRLVWRALWRACVPKADINDLVHEVFLVVLRKLPTYQFPTLRPGQSPEEQVLAWILKITFYEVKNYRARQRYRRVEPMDQNPETPDARDEAARLHDREQLLVLLYSTTPERRAVFELVDLEGFSVVEAAAILEITEANATRRLGLARRDLKKAAEQLARRDRDAGKKEPRAFLAAFGMGAWESLRDLQDPPDGTIEEIWKRLQTTAETIEREDDRPATPPPHRPPLRSRLARVGKAIGAQVKSAMRYVLAGCVGGALVALLLLRRPETRIAILRFPVPVVFSVPSAVPAGASSANSDDAPTSSRAIPSAAATLDPAEARLLRKAQAAYAAGDMRAASEAIRAYDMQFPAGRLQSDARALQTALRDAGVK